MLPSVNETQNQQFPSVTDCAVLIVAAATGEFETVRDYIWMHLHPDTDRSHRKAPASAPGGHKPGIVFVFSSVYLTADVKSIGMHQEALREAVSVRETASWIVADDSENSPPRSS
ncbi:elongation factor [Culex quinquefasciatus]|uniref:Elongation factor n=1 Tax=Culex quinquefasciatus TaxID=7176 RepID=B0WQU2_CULQU|nr:elongation factor [Culex quinquefasciatus]|eukprot:XP_001851076.1 elongation factor [Culex quinquefasciatus]